MTNYEKLIAEYDNKLDISERKMKNKGLYADNCIWINKDMKDDEKTCILAEEIGHYHTSTGDILDQSNIENYKQEYIARKWAYEKIVPIENIIFAITDGHSEIWDMAEYLDVNEIFLREALIYYGFLQTA